MCLKCTKIHKKFVPGVLPQDPVKMREEERRKGNEGEEGRSGKEKERGGKGQMFCSGGHFFLAMPMAGVHI